MTATLHSPDTEAIDLPGVYDIPADQYHRDPVPGGSLSASGAKRLLPPSCPALFRHWTTSGEAHKSHFDFGHAAHMRILGAGPDVVVVDAPDWKTKAAREQRAAAYEAGAVPVLTDEWSRVEAMTAALRAHPVANALFNPERGKPEQSLFWVDAETGVRCRGRLDWMPHFTTYPVGGPTRGYPGRLIIPDYKTCHSAAPDDIQRAIHQHGYHQQAAWYVDGVKAVYPAWTHPAAPDPAFVFVFQEKTPPYLVTVVQLDVFAMRVGRYLNRQALDIYAECTRNNRWPGYSDDIELIPLPAWVERQYSHEEIW